MADCKPALAFFLQSLGSEHPQILPGEPCGEGLRGHTGTHTGGAGHGLWRSAASSALCLEVRAAESEALGG